MAEDLVVAREGRVLTLTLNRPDKHNPLSRAVLAQIRAAFDAARDDTTLACAVITGAGDRYFAAGGDLRDIAHVREPADTRAMALEARAALDAVRTFPLPVIGVLNGDAIGGGAELAVACDFRLMRAGAHIGYIHGKLAITTAWGGGPDLVALVGPARALRMTARCELIEATTAVAWGLADGVAPPDGLAAAVQAFIAPLLRQGNTALRAGKAQSLAPRRGMPFEARLALEHEAFVSTWTHADHWAAVDRILAPRTPDRAPDTSS